jgi:hypothetical protein
VARITMWQCGSYSCILVVGTFPDRVSRLQLVEHNEVLLEQSLATSSEAMQLALDWQLHYEPVIRAAEGIG